jgi:hypothetical protein
MEWCCGSQEERSLSWAIVDEGARSYRVYTAESQRALCTQKLINDQ